MKQVMTIGRLLNVEIVPLGSKTRSNPIKRSFKNKWLCTSANGRDLLICRVLSKSTKKVNPSVASRHRMFHQAPPKGAWKGELIEPQGKLKKIGLLKALTYNVPGCKIRSPEKNPYHWHHKFGDTGHKGGEYPTKYYPAVYEDTKGNIFIKRRPGNIFKNTDWIRG